MDLICLAIVATFFGLFVRDGLAFSAVIGDQSWEIAVYVAAGVVAALLLVYLVLALLKPEWFA